MAVMSWLIDKSAYARMQGGQAARIEESNARIERGRGALSTVTRLELGLSARSGRAGREAFGLPPCAACPADRSGSLPQHVRDGRRTRTATHDRRLVPRLGLNGASRVRKCEHGCHQTWEAVRLASIVVRGLDESVKARLAAQAKQHGRSMEAEVRAIVTDAATRPNIGLALLQAAQSVGGVDDLPVPERADTARAAALS